VCAVRALWPSIGSTCVDSSFHCYERSDCEEEQRVHERAVSERCAMLLQFWLDGEERLRMLREIRDERLDAKEAVRESKKLAEWCANLEQPGNIGLQSSASIDAQVRVQLPPTASVRGNVLTQLTCQAMIALTS
jgi:hypothetical protein